MKAMKKSLALLLALAMSVALVACGDNSSSGSNDTKTDASDNSGSDESYTATLKLAWTVGWNSRVKKWAETPVRADAAAQGAAWLSGSKDCST